MIARLLTVLAIAVALIGATAFVSSAAASVRAGSLASAQEGGAGRLAPPAASKLAELPWAIAAFSAYG